MNFARIKIGAVVRQELNTYRWPLVPCPTCERPLDVDREDKSYVLTCFFERVFTVEPFGWPYKDDSLLRLQAVGFRSFSDEPCADESLYGNGSLCVAASDVIEATKLEFVKSEQELAAYRYRVGLGIDKDADSNNECLTALETLVLDRTDYIKGSLQGLAAKAVVEHREVRCRRTQVQNIRCQYAFVILKPNLEMFEDDNCDGGGYRTWSAGMDDILACDWYEIEDVGLGKGCD